MEMKSSAILRITVVTLILISVCTLFNINGELLHGGDVKADEEVIVNENINKVVDESSRPKRRGLLASDISAYFDYLRELNQDDIMYYNLKKDGKPLPLANILSVYPKNGPCIVTLVPNVEKDIDELKRGLKSLKFLKGDSETYPAPVLIFNENDLPDEVKMDLANSTKRPVAFPIVDFTSFPEGFNPDEENVDFKVKGRKEWGYYQMIRFWLTGIWLHPALVPFENVMRIDSDSCFMETNPTLPNFPTEQAVYHSQYVGLEPKKEFVKGLWEWNMNWLIEQGSSKEPKASGNPMFWHYVQNTYELHNTFPLFRTNFELAKKSFMQKRDIAQWHEAMTEAEPFGIYRNRWGDAVIRFLMTAIFPTSEMIVMSRPAGYAHKNLCIPEEYAKRYHLDLETLKKTIDAED